MLQCDVLQFLVPNMAYRWNLDYVVDTHHDTIAYFYQTETNYYARDLGSTANGSYIRGGYLSKIEYGQRDGSVYTTTPAAEVSFTVNGRCDTSSTGCATSTLSSSTASDWPDVPYDLNCASGASCSQQAPSFWTEYEVTGIQMQALSGSSLTNTDSCALTYAFPPTGDTTKPSLWLSTIIDTGQDTSAGGSSAPINLPPVTFTGHRASQPREPHRRIPADHPAPAHHHHHRDRRGHLRRVLASAVPDVHPVRRFGRTPPWPTPITGSRLA